MPRHVKRSEKDKNWPESLGELRFTLGVFTYHLVFCFFFQLVGVNSLGGRNLAISGVAMKLTPQEKWKILPIVEQLREPPTIGIRQLKGDSTPSGWTAIHNHQTSTKRKFWKDQTSNVLKSQFPSKYMRAITLYHDWPEFLRKCPEHLSFPLTYEKHTRSHYRKQVRKQQMVTLEPSPYTVCFLFSPLY